MNDLKLRARAAELEAQAIASGIVNPEASSNRNPELEADAQAWLKHYFPDSFSREFTKSQKRYIKVLSEIKPGEYFRPVCLCDPRGLGKSTVTRGMIVYLLATKKREFAVIISANDKLAERHFIAVKKMLEDDQLVTDYPHLKPQEQKLKATATSWSTQRLACAGGGTVEVSSILGSIRGFANEKNRRPDFFDFTDADDKKESSDVTAKKVGIIRDDFLPALSRWGSCVSDQNLIHRGSIVSGILDHSLDLLNDRIFIGPNPMMKWYDAVREPILDEHGEKEGERWRITAGEMFDDAVPMEVAEQELNKSGKAGFERECQQNVTIIDEENDFREFDEIYHICTVDEVIAGFKRAGVTLEKGYSGQLLIPDRWECGDGHDWGTTPGHPAVYTLFARPDKRFPYDDLHLGLIERCLPKYPRKQHEDAEIVSPGRFAKTMTDARNYHRLMQSQIKISRMSHEASAALGAYLLDCPDETRIFFQKWKASVGSGVPQMQNLMAVDKTKPHPFRVYPKGHKEAGRAVMGYTRFILVVGNGQGELYADVNGTLRVKAASDQEGFSRARFEIPLYNHHNLSNKLKKIDDDWVDAARGCLNDFALRAGKLTTHEQIISQLPEGWQDEHIAALPHDLAQRTLMAREDEYEEIKQSIRNKRRPVLDTSDDESFGSIADIY